MNSCATRRRSTFNESKELSSNRFESVLTHENNILPRDFQLLFSAIPISNVVSFIRPTLPPSKQANPALLKKAVKEAQVSVEDVQHSEYNPELPASSDMPNISSQNPESKKRQRELLLEEHKKLQRLKSQQEENEENRVK